MDDAVQAARAAFAARSWRRCYKLLADADGQRDLDWEDLLRWGKSAYLTGNDGESVRILTRAHQSGSTP